MTTLYTRRQLLKLGISTTGLCLPACRPSNNRITKTAHIVIVGGGFAGATAAKYLRILDAGIRITLIEPHKSYSTCPGSNWVFAGIKTLADLTFNYQTLANKYNIKVIHDRVHAIHAEKHRVTLSDQSVIAYDRLIVAPGIDFHWGRVDGYTPQTANSIPHAWQGGQQTALLMQQLQNMRKGGTVIICAPANPFRCPPGPYERASMIAYYLSRHNPTAKLIVLDAKSSFSKQSLFISGWEQHYGYGSTNSLITWQPIPDNRIIAIDVKTKTVLTDFGDQFRADVLNFIPDQRAGSIARKAGLTDSNGWCPVHPISNASLLQPDIHVLGDAAICKPLPKSAFAANSQAKVCALAIISLLNGRPPSAANWVNTCYSLITPEKGISIAMVYKSNQSGKITKVPGSGGLTAMEDHDAMRLEAYFAHRWYDSITADSFL